MNLLKAKEWDWKVSGVLLGLIFIITVAVVKPIGVSTQFVILDGIFWKSINKELIVKDDTAKKGYSSTNPYFNKGGGKYAKNISEPLNYSFVFVVAMIFGGFLAYKLQEKKEDKDERVIPKVWSESLGNSHMKRYIYSFIGGFLVLFGARLAGGCSSGHMMSGMMQTSISGYLFAFSTFIVAIPVAIVLFRKGE